MKFCKKCGSQLEDDAVFCPACGQMQTSASTAAVPQTPAPQPAQAAQPSQAPAYSQPAQAMSYSQPQAPAYSQQPYQDYNQQPPKKSKTGLIIGLIVGALVIIAIVFVLIFVVFKKDSSGSKSSESSSTKNFESPQALFKQYVKALNDPSKNNLKIIYYPGMMSDSKLEDIIDQFNEKIPFDSYEYSFEGCDVDDKIKDKETLKEMEEEFEDEFGFEIEIKQVRYYSVDIHLSAEKDGEPFDQDQTRNLMVFQVGDYWYAGF